VLLAPIDRFYSDASRSVEAGKMVRQMQRLLPIGEFHKRAGPVKI